MDSYEFSQWMAWEYSGEDWETETLARIQESLQMVSYLLGQANFTDEDNREGPVPPPKRIRRPCEPREDATLSVADDPEDESANN